MPKEQFKSRYMQKHYICVTLVILGFNLESCAIRKKEKKKKEEKISNTFGVHQVLLFPVSNIDILKHNVIS